MQLQRHHHVAIWILVVILLAFIIYSAAVAKTWLAVPLHEEARGITHAEIHPGPFTRRHYGSLCS